MDESGATFDILSDPGDGDCVIEIRGDLDHLPSLVGLRAVLRDAIAARPVMLIVDLAEVTSIDVSGLAVLAAARRDGLEVGARLLLQAPTASTVGLLTETGLDRVLPIVPDFPLTNPHDRPRRPFPSR
jgi:stage II sporulation protein AA (anti-sigma F factor antagonist)